MADVPIRDLAGQLKVDRSQLRKWIIKHLPNVSITKIRDPNGGGQEVIAVSDADAQTVIARRTDWDGSRIPSGEHGQSQFGVFYAIQLLPEIYPARIKFGYATDVDNRLATHRCTCPNAKLLKTWRCDPQWEYAALNAIANLDASIHVGGEVYDCDAFDLVASQLDRFFEMLIPSDDGV